ncbi:N5-glutamine S-adenosyl-L-methionine-dependent methyltransferase [Kitasatospora cheerisanensis KCTC 2395]|uniref:N5-glutamine S-adenosyl-L-methionine-dependent methyltransferase n=1 Tax=Kitasatospora cheerisanensis KCTC 2395 TaxID=1348663 RepID=A0A066YWL0_9ACTN|nr:N5-glutamine S-adenosyl-L-methionine-dependent methyltransferase [Kitasatospora cheerisanensis KCTC 2395]
MARREVPVSLPLPPARPAEALLVDRLRAAGCVFAEDEARLLAAAADHPARLAEMLELRCAGHPLEQVVGFAEFAGLRIALAPGVFVPRRRSEFLVERAAALGAPGTVVLDLCCGSGAIGAALAARLGAVELHAADVDPAAAACARRNLAPYGGAVHLGDLDAPLPGDLRGRVGLLVANAPYVPTGEIPLLPPEARDHEPQVALDGGADGLAVQRRVAAVAPRWLAPGGHLLIETSGRQAPATAALMTARGLAARIEQDEERDATVVIGTRRG